jgi:hypothetical protein
MRFILRKYAALSLGIVFLLSCQSPSGYANELNEIVAKINKKCPQMLDSETRFDGMEFKEPNILIYKYTLINLSAESVDTAMFRKSMWPGLLSTVKVSAEMQKLRDNNTTLEYLYNDRSDKVVSRFVITPGHYQ